MLETNDDVRIRDMTELNTPGEIIRAYPATQTAAGTVTQARQAVQDIVHRRDDRLLVVIGPCSIHDPEAAMDYAARLAELRDRLGDQLEIVMRVYFAKPRTTVGWKGLINDPNLDGSFEIERGLRLARKLLLDINNLGLPAGCEHLVMTIPQYISDLVSWAAIGARTTESQVHRELASGTSCPVGFKNGTNGDVKIAVDAVASASQPHHFLAVTKDGRSAIAATLGNPDCHVILRGGKTPNFDAVSVEAACDVARTAGQAEALIIDASHANSAKDPENQPKVMADVARQIAGGEGRIVGVMIESHLVAGRQDLIEGQPLTYGQSITDGCIDWDTSVQVLEGLAEAVVERRKQGS
ncbi:MAG: 3-deoxy-7-phosphoheptulonate synthase [Rhodospirillaceae bacterium]|nr:3-deoxy-7-phosphoheptulonate synthase [Rhodospirillaceae bacterium]